MAGNPAEPELAARPAALAVPLAALTRRRSPRCQPRRASASSRWPYTLHSPGGDGDRAEGRTPFAALSAGARGGRMERSDLPTADTSRTPPHLHQARAGAVSLPAQCLPLTRTSAPAVHAPPAPGAAPGPSGAALPGVPALASQGQPLQPGEPPRPPAGAARTGPPSAPSSRASQPWPRAFPLVRLGVRHSPRSRHLARSLGAPAGKGGLRAVFPQATCEALARRRARRG